MSCTETHFGKLRRVEIDNDVKISDWVEENEEDIYNGKYIVRDPYIYEIIGHEQIDEDDLSKFILNEDGTITFIVQFYNGGCGLGEVLEEGIDNLNKNV